MLKPPLKLFEKNLSLYESNPIFCDFWGSKSQKWHILSLKCRRNLVLVSIDAEYRILYIQSETKLKESS